MLPMLHVQRLRTYYLIIFLFSIAIAFSCSTEMMTWLGWECIVNTGVGILDTRDFIFSLFPLLKWNSEPLDYQSYKKLSSLPYPSLPGSLLLGYFLVPTSNNVWPFRYAGYATLSLHGMKQGWATLVFL